MKINKFAKKKDGMYSVTLEDETKLLVHEEIILKYDLLIKKKITNEEIEKILEENLNYIAYNLALKYITTKMRCKKEVEDYLKNKKVDDSIVKKVIEMLEYSKYLDEEQYVLSFINDKIILTNDGPNKIIKELLAKDISSAIIYQKIDIFTDEIQKEKIEKVANKIVKSNRNKSVYMLKNKIIEYLSNLGYEKSMIIEYINDIELQDNKNIIEKEYEKVYKKLSKKYSGKELEYKVKQKMYSLGFNVSDLGN